MIDSDFPGVSGACGTRSLSVRGSPVQDWSLEETARVFMASVYAFHERRAADVGSASFTKDDPLAVAVVAAASNLRSHAYGIPRQPQFAAMGMAGNIIHAIATTNAVVAGLITLEATKLLSGCEAACRTTFLSGVRPPSNTQHNPPTRKPAHRPADLRVCSPVSKLCCVLSSYSSMRLVGRWV